MTPARRRPLVAALPLLLSAVLVPVALTPSSSGAAAPPGERPVAAAAHAWVTTPAPGGLRMADQGSVPFTDGGSDRLTLTVDPSLRYQRMDGFGASITDSSASLLMDLDATTRDATMRDLFAGNGISFLRQPVGSSDFVDGPHYTFDDVAPGETDFDLSEFSIEHDRAEILPLLRQARGAQPRPQGDGDAVEPAGLDEDRRLPGRRPPQGRPPRLPGVRRLPGEVRPGVRRRGRAGLRADHPERAAEPPPQRLPRHGPAGAPGGRGHRPARARAQERPD